MAVKEINWLKAGITRRQKDVGVNNRRIQEEEPQENKLMVMGQLTEKSRARQTTKSMMKQEKSQEEW